jgi:drug/metabolite transporter (DMT)-like permease
VLLTLALYRGDRLPSTAHEWKLMCFFSIVLIALSSGPSTFALKHLPSNEVALLNASLALWIAGLGTLGPKGQSLSRISLLGLLLGFIGVALLVWPADFRLTSHVGWQLLVLAAALVWSAGTIIYRNMTMPVGPVGFNAIIMLLGGLVLFVAGAASGELPRWHWGLSGVLALIFLGVFTSAMTYSAFTWLMKNARTDRVATFAYVNPAIATLLGWMVLGESLTPQQILGMLVVLGGVVLVTMPSRHF